MLKCQWSNNHMFYNYEESKDNKNELSSCICGYKICKED